MTISVVERSDGAINISAAIRVIFTDFFAPTPFLSSSALLIYLPQNGDEPWARPLGEFLREHASRGHTITHTGEVAEERTMIVPFFFKRPDSPNVAVLDEFIGHRLKTAYETVLDELSKSFFNHSNERRWVLNGTMLMPLDHSSQTYTPVRFVDVGATVGEKQNFLFEVAGIRSPDHIVSPWLPLHIVADRQPDKVHRVEKDTQEHRLLINGTRLPIGVLTRR